jgi:cobalamin biosynthesis protein CbiG
MDKITKWIEVRDVTTITSKEAAKFIEDITHRFGVPNRIVIDLGKALTGSDF